MDFLGKHNPQKHKKENIMTNRTSKATFLLVVLVLICVFALFSACDNKEATEPEPTPGPKPTPEPTPIEIVELKLNKLIWATDFSHDGENYYYGFSAYDITLGQKEVDGSYTYLGINWFSVNGEKYECEKENVIDKEIYLKGGERYVFIVNYVPRFLEGYQTMLIKERRNFENITIAPKDTFLLSIDKETKSYIENNYTAETFDTGDKDVVIDSIYKEYFYNELKKADFFEDGLYVPNHVCDLFRRKDYKYYIILRNNSEQEKTITLKRELCPQVQVGDSVDVMLGTKGFKFLRLIVPASEIDMTFYDFSLTKSVYFALCYYGSWQLVDFDKKIGLYYEYFRAGEYLLAFWSPIYNCVNITITYDFTV